MRRAERAAYYVAFKHQGLQFLHYDQENKAKRLTTCPHDATLFTSQSTAETFAEDLRNSMGQELAKGVGVVPTRTNAPNVYTGAGKP
jgi:uroporphyrinogen-III synthase